MTAEQHTEPLAPVEPAPLLGTHGEPCGSCGAPLAADQRYCLNCGARRADARLAFRDILGAPATAPGAAPPPHGGAAAPPPSADGGRSGTIAALAGLGVTLLALGTGVVIGSAGSDPAPAPAPQVITVGGAPAAAATPAGADGAAAGAAAGTAKGGRRRTPAASGGSGGKAANPSLRKLDNLSPQQYQKQSQKLPKVVGTGGAPPPKDDKPAAGGGDFQSIG